MKTNTLYLVLTEKCYGGENIMKLFKDTRKAEQYKSKLVIDNNFKSDVIIKEFHNMPINIPLYLICTSEPYGGNIVMMTTGSKAFNYKQQFAKNSKSDIRIRMIIWE